MSASGAHGWPHWLRPLPALLVPVAKLAAGIGAINQHLFNQTAPKFSNFRGRVEHPTALSLASPLTGQFPGRRSITSVCADVYRGEQKPKESGHTWQAFRGYWQKAVNAPVSAFLSGTRPAAPPFVYVGENTSVLQE
jgi:hypothetical protein